MFEAVLLLLRLWEHDISNFFALFARWLHLFSLGRKTGFRVNSKSSFYDFLPLFPSWLIKHLKLPRLQLRNVRNAKPKPVANQRSSKGIVTLPLNRSGNERVYRRIADELGEGTRWMRGLTTACRINVGYRELNDFEMWLFKCHCHFSKRFGVSMIVGTGNYEV